MEASCESFRKLDLAVAPLYLQGKGPCSWQNVPPLLQDAVQVGAGKLDLRFSKLLHFLNKLPGLSTEHSPLSMAGDVKSSVAPLLLLFLSVRGHSLVCISALCFEVADFPSFSHHILTFIFRGSCYCTTLVRSIFLLLAAPIKIKSQSIPPVPVQAS